MKTNPPQPQINLVVPVMERELFAQQSGLTSGQLLGQLNRRNLPTLKVGKFLLVNTAKLALGDHPGVPRTMISCPVLTAAAFAAEVGLTPQQVRYQLEKGNLPRRLVGRHVMVDVAELTRICLAQTDEGAKSA